ncbi:MAG TPA: PhzF family phenazine biosynthesis protein [Longimicrobiaceae bacterium]|nr:PhzF family phenazine biosynthesis protein [Longimicrobiaceae bacterium]
MDARGGPELWQAVVFHSVDAVGNPTGVVFGAGGFDAAARQRWAALLGFPDTVFLDRSAGQEGWNAETFSPSQPISFCIQTLLASAAVLRLRGDTRKDRETFLVGGRRLEAGALPGAPPGVEWLPLARKEVCVLREGVLPRSLRPAAAAAGVVVDAGRRRLYLELASRGELEGASLAAPEVLAFCREEELHGVCLFARTGPAEAALRVFTTSLDGHEDAATGGAVAGLSVLLDPAGRPDGTEWTVRQGHGPPHRRGRLFLRCEPAEEQLWVGGRVRVLAAGRLLMGAEG